MAVGLPTRNKQGHKGTFGTVAIAAGSINSTKVTLGGAAFAAKAAIRSGAGMTAFVGDKDVLVSLIKMVPQSIGIINKGDYSDEAEKWQSIVIGPALGLEYHNVKLIRDILKLELPTVVDADALNTIVRYPDLASNIHDKCVLTPHIKEFERLSDAFDTNNPDNLATKLGCTIVLKSSSTVVVDGKQAWQKYSNNPVLATAGTGDVLAGLIGGLMAQYCPDQLSVFECAQLGVEIHAKAAEEWKRQYGSSGLIIDELLEFIPKVMEKMR